MTAWSWTPAPGCTPSRHLHAHHAVEWGEDGPTDMDNLVLLCGFHHRFVHRMDWRTVPLGRGRFRFEDADGKAMARVGGGGTDSAESPPWAGLPSVRMEAAPIDVLQPSSWHGDRVDVDLCVLVLRQALEGRVHLAGHDPGRATDQPVAA